MSFSSGDIPKDWLRAPVVPVLKKYEWSLLANYRPIGLTCITCKLMKHIRGHYPNDYLVSCWSALPTVGNASISSAHHMLLEGHTPVRTTYFSRGCTSNCSTCVSGSVPVSDKTQLDQGLCTQSYYF